VKLIDNVGIVWHRLWVVRMAILGVIFASAGSAWLLMPDEWKPTLSEPVRWVLAFIGVSLAAAPGISRVIAQPKVAEAVTAQTGTVKITVPAPLVDNSEHA
jgi:hypothetical protein